MGLSIDIRTLIMIMILFTTLYSGLTQLNIYTDLFSKNIFTGLDLAVFSHIFYTFSHNIINLIPIKNLFTTSGLKTSSYDTELHLYLDKNVLNEDPNDKIIAKICWRNLPPPLQDSFSYYIFRIAVSEKDYEIILAEKILFVYYIDRSEGCTDLEIKYVTNLYGENIISVSGEWRGEVKTFMGTIYSVETYNVSVNDKFVLNDITSLSYDRTNDLVIINLSKYVMNSVILYNIQTFDDKNNSVRYTGSNPLWRYLWFNGSSVAIKLPGDPSPEERYIVVRIQKRGLLTKDFVIDPSFTTFYTQTVTETKTITYVPTITIPLTSTTTSTVAETRKFTTTYPSNMTYIVYTYVTKTLVLRETMPEILTVTTTKIVNKTLANPTTKIVNVTVITEMPVLTTVVLEKTLITKIFETETIVYENPIRSTETLILSQIDPGLSISLSIPLLAIGILIGYYILRRRVYGKT